MSTISESTYKKLMSKFQSEIARIRDKQKEKLVIIQNEAIAEMFKENERIKKQEERDNKINQLLNDK